MKVNVSMKAVPIGTYHAEYMGGEMIKTPKGVNDQAYCMSFKILGGESDGMVTTRLVNPGGKSPKSYVIKYFSALAGVQPTNDMDLDDSDYIGAKYEIVVVKQGEDGYTKFEDINRRLGDEEKADSASNEAPF